MSYAPRPGSRSSGGPVGLKLLGGLLVALVILLAALGPGQGLTAEAVWWLTNDRPPELAVRGPNAAVRGVVAIPVELQPAGRVDLVGADLDGRPVALNGSGLAVDTLGLPDGEHTLTVRAQDRSLRRNGASAALRLNTDNTPPVLELQASPPSVPQGHTAVIYIRSNEPADVRATLGGTPLRLFPAGSGYWAAVGIDPDEEPGPKPLAVEARDRAGNGARAEGTLGVEAFTFTSDSLQFPPGLEPLLAPAVRTAEDQRLQAVYAPEGGPPLWKGAFVQPVKGPISTEFGEIRSYNGRPFEGHHGGTDFEVGPGQAVLAPARGRVVFREEVRLRGKVLILDHGGGVYTTYAHLQDWLAEVGQEVQPAQPIAKVGSTGLSTGPHLHWELWVGGKNVDPLEWTQREVP